MPENNELGVVTSGNTSDLTKNDSSPTKLVEKYFNDLKVESLEQINPNALNDREIKEIHDKLRSELKAGIKASDADFFIHVTFILVRAAVISTSPSLKYDGANSYKINGLTYTVSDSWIYPVLKQIMSPMNKPNPVRTFCAAHQDLYLLAAPKMLNMFNNKSVGKRGAPQNLEYLANDFLTATSPLMNDHQRAVTLSASKNALERSATSKIDSRVVSLYDLGKYIVT